jgi:hypothetical protein
LGSAKGLAVWAPGCKVIPIDIVTEGAACTVLLGDSEPDIDNALMIAIAINVWTLRSTIIWRLWTVTASTVLL